MDGDAAEVHHADERRARSTDDVPDVLPGAGGAQHEPRSGGLSLLGKVLLVEAAAEHPVRAALGGEWAVAEPRCDVGPGGVGEARDGRFGDALVWPPGLVRVADRHTCPLDGA